MKKARNCFAIFAVLFLLTFFFVFVQKTAKAANSPEGTSQEGVNAVAEHVTEHKNAEHKDADHADGHDGGEHGDPEQAKKDLNPLLSFQKNTAFWSLVIFGALVFILGKFGFKPIVQALDAREKQVADNIAGAERANTEAKELLKQYQHKLAEAEGEVKAIVEAGKQEAVRASEVILAKAHEASAAERVRATKEIEAATDGALQELATKSADLAVSLAGKILKEKLDPNAHAGLIQTAVSDFSKN